MNPRLRAFSSVLLFLVLSFASASHALAASTCDKGSPAGWFYFLGNDTGYPNGYCKLQLGQPFAIVQVWVNAVPFQKARFTVPDPPFGTIVGEQWLYPHTGDRANGLELTVGTCSETAEVTIKLGELYITVPPEVNALTCTEWALGTAEVLDCTSRWLPAKYIPQRASVPGSDCICDGWQFCYTLPPTNLLPVDGATNVPTDVVLSWLAPYGWDQSGSGCYVFITTDPSCATAPHFLVPCDNDTFAPNFLQPGTTYYWRSTWATDGQWGCAGSAAYQSFTTAPITPVRPSTWGQVKSMYRR